MNILKYYKISIDNIRKIWYYKEGEGLLNKKFIKVPGGLITYIEFILDTYW